MGAQRSLEVKCAYTKESPELIVRVSTQDGNQRIGVFPDCHALALPCVNSGHPAAARVGVNAHEACMGRLTKAPKLLDHSRRCFVSVAALGLTGLQKAASTLRGIRETICCCCEQLCS